MARAVSWRVQEKPPADPDATAQLERPSAGTNVAAPPPSNPPPARRPADRWSTVFTVFAAVALVALLLLGAAVIASQQVAAPSAPASATAANAHANRGEAQPHNRANGNAASGHAGPDDRALRPCQLSAAADEDAVVTGARRSAGRARPGRRPSC